MKILVVNAGSSSLKYQLINMKTQKIIAKGCCERVTLDNSVLVHKSEGKDEVTIKYTMPTHAEAIKLVLDTLICPQCGAIKNMSEISAVGHRVVHTGVDFTSSAIITDDVLMLIKKNEELAPLHMPANIKGIEACIAAMPNTPMVAVFDTAFHSTMPAYASMYAIPYELYTKYSIKRYGFHGTSHKYVSGEAIKYLNNPNANIVTCHLGNGSSMAAVKEGKSIDTSMGFTPLEGVPMGTRSGDIDAAVLPYLMNKKGLTIDGALALLNKESGVLGISGVGSDFRDLAAAKASGNKRAELALDIFCYKVKKYVGSYAAAMGGLDCIVFTGGIGENNFEVRKAVASGLEFMGVQFDDEKNTNIKRGAICDISKDNSKVKILVIPTNEELVIARETLELL